MRRGIFETLSQMVEESSFVIFVVVIGAHFIQDREIPGFSEISSDSCDKPQRVIVETSADRTVAAFGKRLILMISASVRELGIGDIDDPFSCAGRDQVYETKQILT